MRITTFFSEALHVERDGISKDRRGGSGGGYGGQKRQSRQDENQKQSDDNPSIGSLLGEALGQYHESSAFEYSL